MAFYGAIEQVLTGWIFGLLEEGERRLRAREALRRRHDLRRPRGASRRRARIDSADMTDNEMVKRLMWSGPAGGDRRARLDRDDEGWPHLIWVRAFGEDPPE